MPKKRSIAISRLMKAWLGLAAAVIIAIVLVFLMPSREEPVSEVVLTVPSEPDRYAGAEPFEDNFFPEEEPQFSNAQQAPDMAEIVTPEEDDLIPMGSLEDVIAAAGPDAVVITVPNGGTTTTPDSEMIRQTSRRPPTGPNDELIAQSAQGPKPKVGPNGETPFEAYRHIVSDTDGKGIAIIVSGLGINPQETQRAIRDLPSEVTLSFVPYTKDLPAVIAAATQAGHEVVIEIPMEQASVDVQALGPAGLSTERSIDANTRRLEWIMSRAPAYAMMTNYLGGTFSADNTAIGPVLSSIKSSGLGYIDDTGLAGAIAARMNLPYASVDLVVAPGGANIASQLDGLLQREGADHPPLAKIYAGEGGLNSLIEWVASEKNNGVVILPASSAVSKGKS